MKLRNSNEIIEIHNNHTDHDEMLVNVISRIFNSNQTIWITPDQLYELGKHFDKLFKVIPQSHVKMHFGELNDVNCDFTKMLSEIKSEKLVELNIISDLSKMPIDYFNRIASYCKERKLKFSLTLYHKNEHDDVDCYNKITELRKQNNSEFFDMHITYVISETEIPDEDTIDFMNKAIADGFDVRINLGRDVRMKNVPQKVIEWKDKQTTKIKRSCEHENDYTVTYTDGTQESFRTIYELRYALDNNICTEGFYCSAGLTQLHVFPNGNLVRHICPYLRKFKSIANIITDDEIVLPKKYILCGLDADENCPSSGRMNIVKRKPD